jgi:hypothetical protein
MPEGRFREWHGFIRAVGYFRFGPGFSHCGKLFRFHKKANRKR